MCGVYSGACSRAEEGHSTYSKPRVNDLSYTAESSSCLYRIISSSRPKSKLADGGLLVLAGEFVEALLDDIIGNESVVTGEDVDGDKLFMRAAAPAGLTRRRTGERSAKPDADGRVVARMATMTMATEVKI
mmetsp:Transcript_11992/g.24171  ORF Transcript_11992/g.24171 Transcript_11992/m.24171 type:complete len:131 (-) Transcript_11992:95-487(-)